MALWSPMTVEHWTWWTPPLLRLWKNCRIYVLPMESVMNIGMCSSFSILLYPYGWLGDVTSFVFHPSCQLFERRNGWVLLMYCPKKRGLIYEAFRKLVTTIVSTFTAHYIYQWSTYFPTAPLQPPYLPSFDGRAVIYPSTGILRDYMSWRQVDCESSSFSLSCSIGWDAYMGCDYG